MIFHFKKCDNLLRLSIPFKMVFYFYFWMSKYMNKSKTSRELKYILHHVCMSFIH